MALPVLTAEQRAQALAKAAIARKERAEIKGGFFLSTYFTSEWLLTRPSCRRGFFPDATATEMVVSDWPD